MPNILAQATVCPGAAGPGGVSGGDRGNGGALAAGPRHRNPHARAAADGEGDAGLPWWRGPSRRTRLGPRKFDRIVRPHPALAFLFRRRTFFLLLGAVAMLAWARPQPLPYAIGLLLAAAGVAVRNLAAGTLHKSRQVTTSGPDAWVRHPLYLGAS